MWFYLYTIRIETKVLPQSNGPFFTLTLLDLQGACDTVANFFFTRTFASLVPIFPYTLLVTPLYTPSLALTAL